MPSGRPIRVVVLAALAACGPAPEALTPRCGDGLIHGLEECDCGDGTIAPPGAAGVANLREPGAPGARPPTSRSAASRSSWAA